VLLPVDNDDYDDVMIVMMAYMPIAAAVVMMTKIIMKIIVLRMIVVYVFRAFDKINRHSGLYRDQLPLTNPRDGLRHGKRTANKGGRSV